jgi:succinoglycan biosynthesis transport protein ExoP
MLNKLHLYTFHQTSKYAFKEDTILEEEISLRELIETMLNGKWIIAAITAIAVLTAGIFSFFLIEPTYEARTTLMVSATAPKPTETETNGVETLLESLSKYPQMTMETYRTQVTNPYIIREVINELNLDPEKYTVESLSDSISVEAIKDTNLIRIMIKDKDPKLAADIANSVSNKFVAYLSETVKQQLSRSSQFIKEQMDAEKLNLDQITAEYKEFISQPRGVNELTEEVTSRIKLLTDFKTEMVNLEVSKANLETSIAAIQKELSEQPRTLTTSKSVTDDPLMQDLINEQTGGSTLSTAGLKMESEEINPIYVSLMQSLTDNRIQLAQTNTELSSLEQKIRITQSQLETLQAELAEKQIEQERLQRQLDLAKKNYNNFLETYQETRITQSAQIGEANIMVVAPAYTPEAPVAPRKMLNMAIAAVLGVMMGMFIVFFMEYWRTSTPKQLTISK